MGVYNYMTLVKFMPLAKINYVIKKLYSSAAVAFMLIKNYSAYVDRFDSNPILICFYDSKKLMCVWEVVYIGTALKSSFV